MTPASRGSAEKVEIEHIPLARIRLPGPAGPVQHDPSAAEVERFCRAVRATGAIEQPLIVRPVSDTSGEVEEAYELVAGRLRLEAARSLGWPRVPCRVRPLSDEAAQSLSLLEDLSGKDEPQLIRAWRLKRVLEATGWSQQELAAMTRLSPGQVSELLSFARAVPEKAIVAAVPEGTSRRECVAGLTRGNLRRVKRAKPGKDRDELLQRLVQGEADGVPNGRRCSGSGGTCQKTLVLGGGSVRIDPDRISALGIRQLLLALWQVIGAVFRHGPTSRLFAPLRRAK